MSKDQPANPPTSSTPEIKSWWQAVEIIQPHLFKISTPNGSGSGFMISNGKISGVCGVATAAHVIHHAYYWEEPIRLEHVGSGKSVVVRHNDRGILLDANRDTATLLFHRGDLPLPDEPLPIAPYNKFLKMGNEIAWLGFPAIPQASLCFFSGNVSACLETQNAYLVDGVAINGVSGGPAFHLHVPASPVLIMGVVSAYVPNRATGEVLPGLSVVRDVSHFHELAPQFASLEQAQAQSAETPPTPPPPHPGGGQETAMNRSL